MYDTLNKSSNNGQINNYVNIYISRLVIELFLNKV